MSDDLAGWLLEQIAEDERQVAELRESDYGDRTLIEEVWSEHGIYAPDISDFGGLWISPTRVLAECEAKRRIIELHKLLDDNTYRGAPCCARCTADGEYPADDDYTDTQNWPCPTLRAMALPYADRPGYREEWRP